MITKNKVGRPAKTFKPKPKLNIIRPRGRPRKDDQEQLKEIKNIPISFVKNRLQKKSIVDNIALGLLVVSILLFIFSIVYKNNKTNNLNENIDKISIQENKQEEKQLDKENITISNTSNSLKEVQKEKTKDLSIQEQIIYDFYKNINEKNFSNLSNFIDIPLKQSSAYKNYYNSLRLTNFLNNISENSVYISNIKEIPNSGGKAKKYEYTITYKLNSSNTSFVETRNTSIVYKNEKNLIGSIMCISTGCSKNPFFNPQRYGIK